MSATLLSTKSSFAHHNIVKLVAPLHAVSRQGVRKHSPYDAEEAKDAMEAENFEIFFAAS